MTVLQKRRNSAASCNRVIESLDVRILLAKARSADATAEMRAVLGPAVLEFMAKSSRHAVSRDRLFQRSMRCAPRSRATRSKVSPATGLSLPALAIRTAAR